VPLRSDPPGDGRAARACRTNDLIVGAFLEMLERDGHLRPTASQVAGRAGVSRRALYVHFETVEGLIAVALERRSTEICAGWPDLPDHRTLAARVSWFCQHWSRLAEILVPLRRAAAVHEPFSPQIAAVVGQTRQWVRDAVELTFLPELATRPAAEHASLALALHHAASLGAWDELRIQGVEIDEARTTMGLLITALLADGDPTPPDSPLEDVRHGESRVPQPHP
jgi:AcrR family transcriptional regulator